MSLHPELPEVGHTPEPWRVVPHLDAHVIRVANGVRIAAFDGNGRDFSQKIDDANAKRAVLAVNSVADISNEALEAGVIAELIEAAKEALTINGLSCTARVASDEGHETQSELAFSIITRVEERLRNAIEKAGGDLQ